MRRTWLTIAGGGGGPGARRVGDLQQLGGKDLISPRAPGKDRRSANSLVLAQ